MVNTLLVTGAERVHPLQKVEWKLGTAHATRTGLDVGDDNTETLPPVHAVWVVGIDNHGSPSRVTEEGPEGGKRAKERVRGLVGSAPHTAPGGLQNPPLMTWAECDDRPKAAPSSSMASTPSVRRAEGLNSTHGCAVCARDTSHTTPRKVLTDAVG